MKKRYRNIIVVTVVLFVTHTSIQAQIDRNLLVSTHNVTDTEMNAITNPVTGSLIFNSDDNAIYAFDGTVWQSLLAQGNETKIVVGDNITLTGTGTSADPYTLSASRATLVENSDGSYTFSNGVDADVTFTSGGTGNTPLVTQSDATGSCANQFETNETRNIIIQGDYFDGSSTVTISGQTVNTTTINSATQIMANVTAGNTPGDFDIQVITNVGTGTLANGFSIKTALITNNYNTGNITLSNQMAYTSGTLSRTAGSGWNQQGYSTLYNIPAGKEGHLNFTALTNNRYRMIGLNNDPATNASYTSIDYAIYLVANGQIYIYENGVGRGYKTAYISGDNLSINVDCDGVVTYLKNGVSFYTSAVQATSDLYLDSSFYQTLTDISNISITY